MHYRIGIYFSFPESVIAKNLYLPYVPRSPEKSTIYSNSFVFSNKDKQLFSFAPFLSELSILFLIISIYSLINHNIVSNSERESGLIKSIIILNNE